MSTTLVVLAGGGATRFGSDKLAAALDGSTVLQHCLADLPSDWQLIVVGPPRTLDRPALFVREEPVGSGPAAAVVAGVAAASTSVVVTTPGDALAGAAAARTLVEALLDGPADAVVGVDDHGVDQPLQLALRGDAIAAVATLGSDAADRSARRLLLPLLDPVRVRLPAALTHDVDTPADLRRPSH